MLPCLMMLQNSDWLLLDMDGTLLDLRYDNQFWFHYLPERYAAETGCSKQEAQNLILGHSERIRGTLDFYSMDYWSERLGLDVAMLNAELHPLIRFLPGVPEFLQAWRCREKKALLVTNSHPRGLDFKLAYTGLASMLDGIYSSHDLGYPKEEPEFWQSLRERVPFSLSRALLIDDNLDVLRAARSFGVAYQLVSLRPDSQGDLIHPGEFPGVESFELLLKLVG